MMEETNTTLAPPEMTARKERPVLNGVPAEVSVLERFIVAFLAIALAATCFLISAGRGVKQGYVPWKPDSVLRIIVELLNFNYQYPTIRGVEIKWLVQGLVAAGALLAVTIAWFNRSRRMEQDSGMDRSQVEAPRPEKRSWLLTPPTAATLALAGFAGWAILSTGWSPWPEASFHSGLQLSFTVLWAIILSRTLSRTSIHWAVLAIVLILAATAALGVWYRYERSPEMRLEFPIGNPLFFAACLIPGIVLLPAAFIRRWSRPGRGEEQNYGVGSNRQPSSMTPRLWLFLMAAALVLLLWAFKLADPRGPALGLVAGINVAALLSVRRRRRWVVGLAILVQVVAAYGLYQAHVERSGGNRGATTRMRLCAWRYAGNLALQEPLAGHGRDTYVLLAQQMSIPDVERDPYAFPSAYLGHAHNEWLEVLAELGAVGFALMATALGITFWCILLTLRQPMNKADRWCLLGLSAALAALIVEECFNVALRKPGLPIFFYTIIGLVLAFCRDTLIPKSALSRKHGQPLRIVGLLGGIIVAWAIFAWSWRDWQGALAHTQALEQAEKENWNEAFDLFGLAASERFCVEDRLAALQGTTYHAYRAANWRMQRSRRMLGRQNPQQGIAPQVRMLAVEDAAAFADYFKRVQTAGLTILERAPGWPETARLLGESWLLKGQMERIEQQFGLREQVADYVAEARPWLLAEYRRDRLNWAVAYRLLQLAGDQPLLERLNVARTPLRAGPMPTEMEGLLSTYLREPPFSSTMDQMLGGARLLLGNPDRETWSNAYVPETLRLAALVNKLIGRFAEAARLAEEAAALLDQIRDRFPLTVFYARQDQYRYLFVADPAHPQAAIELCRQMIADWPPSPDRETKLQPIRDDLGRFLLAAGKEDEVRGLMERPPTTTGPALTAQEQLLANLYVQLCQTFSTWPLDHRPVAMADWLRRALELDPRSVNAHLLAVQFALERGENVLAVQHLDTLQQILDEPAQMEPILRSLLARMPDDQTLRNYILQWQQAMTRPAAAEEPEARGP